jgi:hypothetical protein
MLSPSEEIGFHFLGRKEADGKNMSAHNSILPLRLMFTFNHLIFISITQALKKLSQNPSENLPKYFFH